MAYDESLRSITLDADASIGFYTGVSGLPGSAVPNSGKMYRFVKVTGVHKAGLCTAGADVYVGILQNKPQVVGAAATIGFHGISNLVCGGVVTAGDLVVSDADGRGVQGAGGKFQALSTSTVAGELISVLRVL
jgi:hypothetical protein